MDERVARVAIGFALQSAIPCGCEVEALLVLYSKPDLEKARSLHDKLAMSRSHKDREVAIWLQPLLEHGLPKSDPKALVPTMREMEFVLYFLINQAGQAQREVNDWMNYVANATEGLVDGFLIDAKIFMSQALEISQSPAIEQLKSDPALGRKLDILQQATASYFQEIRKYPSKIAIPERRLEPILKVQEILLDLMQLHYGGRHDRNGEVIGAATRRLKAAIRYLMNEDKELEAAEREVQLASEHLSEKESEIVNGEARRLVLRCSKRMKELVQKKAL